MAQNPHSASTGPRTPEGKAVSSLNRLVHGLAGEFRVLGSELQEEFDAAHAALVEEHEPVTPTEAELVRRLAEHAWLARRAQRLQDDALMDDDLKRFALFMRYQAAHDRGFYKALNDLLRLRREQRKSEEFESQTEAKPGRRVQLRAPKTPLDVPEMPSRDKELPFKSSVWATAGQRQV